MKQKRIPLVGEQYLVPFILITSLFFLWGFAHAILDVLNKHFQELLDITKAHSAFIQAMMYMGYFVMAIPAGLFISRFGYRRGVVFGLVLYGVGSLLFIPGQYYLSFNMFLFALFVIGCGLTFLETAANPYATELGAKETAASRLNFAQSFNGLGCICAPVLVGLLLFSEDGNSGAGNVALPYVGMGIVVLLVALVFSNLKSATKLFSVLLASKRPLITELADKLRLKYPLLPTISPCPTMRLEAIRSIIPISCRRYPKSV